MHHRPAVSDHPIASMLTLDHEFHRPGGGIGRDLVDGSWNRDINAIRGKSRHPLVRTPLLEGALHIWGRVDSVVIQRIEVYATELGKRLQRRSKGRWVRPDHNP